MPDRVYFQPIDAALPEAAQAAAEQGIELQIVKLPQARKGFVLLPKR